MIAAVLAVTLGAFAPQSAGSMPLSDPTLEARVQKLGKQLRCTVCQGMSIADSPAQMARAQLDTVRKLVSEGKSDQEVLDFFVQRYGDWSLLEPRKDGFPLLVWAGPVMAVLGGFLFILWFIRQRNAAASAPAPKPVAPAKPNTDDDYLKLVRAELEK